MIKDFSLGDVILKDNFFLQVTEKDIDFLNCFDPDRLLYNFRLTAGLPNKAKGPYTGWENTRIGGHTLGHYLTAAAQGIAAGYGQCKGADGHTLNERISILLQGLSQCQQAAGTGFIFGATMADPAKPELQFDKLEAGDTADTWVPWYTMHKIMNGLVETAKLCNGESGAAALEVAEKLGEWIYRRISSWNSEVQDRVLAVEYGAMNDCLYELYKAAKAAGYKAADHFMQAAHAFDEEKLFNDVLEASNPTSGITDILNNKHANCTIPKFLGAINRCLTLLADEKCEELEKLSPASEARKYFDYAAAFWQLVTERHSYITGGNSECEHFGRDNILDAERSNCNCETCNTHNMLKLTRTLFMLTGDKKYADYYETTFVNAILASVNRETGMTTYFQPMASGCFKTYCNIDVNKNYFWCCTGTGLENFTKLGDSLYFHDEDTLFVNQYVSSELKWQDKGLIIKQQSQLPAGNKVSLELALSDEGAAKSQASVSFTLALRLPDWIASEPLLSINGKEQLAVDFEGYLLINREWASGDRVELTLPMEIAAFALPDNPKAYAFKYGPVVLAAELGRDDKMTLRQVGVQCDVCANKIIRGHELALNGNYGGTSGLKPLATEILLVDDAELDNFMQNIKSHLVRASEAEVSKGYDCSTLSFILKDTSWPGQFKFSPYYRINNQRYGIYWLFTDSPEELKLLEAMAKDACSRQGNYIEGIGVGYGSQTEGNESTWPYMQEEGAGSVADPHELTRYAREGGSFSYMFKILPDEDKKIYLDCSFLKEDEGKQILISSEDTVIAEYTLSSKDADEDDGASEKFTKSFELPASLTNGRKELRICFAGKNGQPSARLAAPVSTSWR